MQLEGFKKEGRDAEAVRWWWWWSSLANRFVKNEGKGCLMKGVPLMTTELFSEIEIQRFHRRRK